MELDISVNNRNQRSKRRMTLKPDETLFEPDLASYPSLRSLFLHINLGI